jgi:hypothetical protein
MVYAVRGNRDDALRVFRQGREIIEKLMKLSPDNASLPKDLLFLDGQIGQLEK